jgi:hypothetical protein
VEGWGRSFEIVAGRGPEMRVGLLLDLSVAQVIGGMVAALAALLGAFLGLSGRPGLALRVSL